MRRSDPASSSSTSGAVRRTLQAFLATWRAMLVGQLSAGGLLGTLLMSVLLPFSTLGILALVYRGRPELIGYAVVGQAALGFIFSAVYFVGQLLDTERVRGTLVMLFLAPCPRFSWLGGFAMAGLVETSVVAASMLAFGYLALGVRFDPNPPALSLSLALFLAALWGIGLVLSAVGLATRRANWLATLISPVILLLGGAYYPIALLPDWLRYPARALPLGYGTQALADAALHGASVGDLTPSLLPLAGFAVVLPLLGIAAFGWIERLVRRRGELDLY